MNGSETLMGACSRLRSHAFRRRIWRSWLRLRSAARLLAPLCRSGSTLLSALALSALALLAAALAWSVVGLTVLALCAPAALLARREIGRRRLLVLANDDLGTIGQVGKAGRHHAIGGRQAAGYHGFGFILLRHHHRFRGDNVAVADDVAERSRGTALHGRGRNNDRLRECVDLEPHIDELSRPYLKIAVGEFGLQLERPGGRIDLVVDAGELAGIDHRNSVIAEDVDR